MLVSFFHELRAAGVPVTLKEYLTLMGALEADLAVKRVENFYYLARTALVKDERNLDRFDRVFGHVFKGLEVLSEAGEPVEIPAAWLQTLAERFFTEEEKAEIAALGGWDAIMEELKKRLAEQTQAHHGGNKWIGTGGTSPFGADGYNPAGVRIGQDASRQQRAVKVWDRRQFKDLDDSVEIGTRNIKMALRRLRRFAREGAAEELDLDRTIDRTANKGYLDLQFRPERRNTVRVLMFFDVGGSMDWHVKEAQELFSAARAEFAHLEYYYFHNCLYEYVWRDNARRWSERIDTLDVLHTYPAGYKVIVVGDAAMSPYEITVAGGASEHMNPQAGAVWLQRLTGIYEHAVWLNPLHRAHWDWTPSVAMISQLFSGRMYPLTLDGLDRAMRELMR